MKRARVSYGGLIHDAVEVDGKVQLSDGRILEETEVVWLPPVEPQTVFTLGLNYADHAAELSFKAPTEPLVFLKGPNTFIGHRGYTVRPSDVTFMHYECELAVVIGKTGKKSKKENAYEDVSEYTNEKDETNREYLEKN